MSIETGDGMQPHMVPAAIVLYSRPECHLCDEMKAVVAPVARAFGASVEEIDISSDPDIEARFATEIPVLFIDGRKAFKYRVTARELQRRLRERA